MKKFLRFLIEGNRMSNIDLELGYKREPIIISCSGCSIPIVCEWRLDLYKTLVKNKIIKGKFNKFGRSPILYKGQEKKVDKILRECMKSVKW